MHGPISQRVSQVLLNTGGLQSNVKMSQYWFRHDSGRKLLELLLTKPVVTAPEAVALIKDHSPEAMDISAALAALFDGNKEAVEAALGTDGYDGWAQELPKEASWEEEVFREQGAVHLYIVYCIWLVCTPS